MNYFKIFSASVLAIGMALGFTSCNSDDIAENAPAADEAQAQLTSAQKLNITKNSMSAFSSTFGKKYNADASKVYQVVNGIPKPNPGEKIQDLKEYIQGLIADIPTTHEIERLIQLCKVYGEYEYNGVFWKVTSLADKDLLKITYTEDGKTNVITIKYADRVKVTSPSLTKETVIFGHTFISQTYVELPQLITVTIEQDDALLADAICQVDLGQPTEGKISYDAATDNAQITLDVISPEYGRSNIVSDLNAETTTTTVTTSTVDGTQISVMTLVINADNSGNLEGIICATPNSPELKVVATIKDVKDLTDMIALLYQTGDESLALMYVAAINSNLDGGIKVYTSINGEDVLLGTLSFDLLQNEDGSYGLLPVMTVNEDLLEEVLPEAEDLVQYIIDLIKSAILGDTQDNI